MLRLYFLDGLSIDQIGEVLRVHRSTAARWVAAVRSRLMTEVHQALLRKLGRSRTELDSWMGQLRSRLDIHLSQLLARAAR